MPDDIEKMLQNLANNLYSKYVTLPMDEIKELEKQLDMVIEKYDANFNENVSTVQAIEESLIKDLVESLKLPQEFYKTETSRYSKPIK
jgi:DNA-binding transcriptional regulator YiaG